MRTRTLLILLISAALAASCVEGTDPESPEAAEEEGETELVWAIHDVDAHGPIADLWNEQHPDTPVRIEELPEEADGQRQQMSLELDAEGDAFDILAVDVIWTGEFAQNGWLEPLDDVRDQLEGVTVPEALETAMWEDSLWGAPYNTNAAFLYYRTDLVDEPPTTWEELVEVGTQAADEEGLYPYVGQGAQYEGMVVNYLELLWSAGGELYSDDYQEVVYGDEAALWAAEFMLEAAESGFYASGFNTMQEEDARVEFQQGEAVFMRNWPYAYSLGQDEEESEVAGNFDIAPLPTFDGDGTISALGGFNNAVSAFSNHPDEAIEFVIWASQSEDAQMMLAESAVPPSLQTVYDQLADDPVMALLGEVLADARPRPPAPEWASISLEMQQTLFPAYNGDMDPTAAAQSVRDFLEGTID
jgi:multiple sugar transport system substrate-binding protein